MLEQEAQRISLVLILGEDQHSRTITYFRRDFYLRLSVEMTTLYGTEVRRGHPKDENKVIKVELVSAWLVPL